MTPKQFALLIEKRASKKRISHMEAVLDYCQEKILEIIEIQTGDYLGEDDIIRLEDDYQRS